ncbi:unknown protein [Seminavis robusta]|uniref:Uncharacterized protein n=1 Tax=Seminavis robusta TaxID=568900 RepID=A0A9N8DMQ0_9STRA|nr:unknown protein [Seminavis robusta]|eukprot:Sro245_g097581.1  (121) ;mRNA; r:80979-81341
MFNADLTTAVEINWPYTASNALTRARNTLGQPNETPKNEHTNTSQTSRVSSTENASQIHTQDTFPTNSKTSHLLHHSGLTATFKGTASKLASYGKATPSALSRPSGHDTAAYATGSDSRY